MKRKISMTIQFLVVAMVIGTGPSWAQEPSHLQRERHPDHIKPPYGQRFKIPDNSSVIAVGPTDPLDDSRNLVPKMTIGQSLPAAWHVEKGSDTQSGSNETWVGHGAYRTYSIPIVNAQWLLFALEAAGEIVGVAFEGSLNTNGDDVDAADTHYELVDFRGTLWSLTGSDLGWSGQGNFGPTRTVVNHDFDGPLESDEGKFTYWELLNRSPWTRLFGSNVVARGNFEITVKFPSPVALMAEFASEGPDEYGDYTQLRRYSHSASPNFAVDYLYRENLGYWSEQPGRECYQGQINPTNFNLGILNLTASNVTSCQFQASWDSQPFPCSQAIIDELNNPTSSRTLLIRTEDYVVVPSPDCSVFTPTEQHVLSGENHWMWVEFVINGVTYTRKINFVKQ